MLAEAVFKVCRTLHQDCRGTAFSSTDGAAGCLSHEDAESIDVNRIYVPRSVHAHLQPKTISAAVPVSPSEKRLHSIGFHKNKNIHIHCICNGLPQLHPAVCAVWDFKNPY